MSAEIDLTNNAMFGNRNARRTGVYGLFAALALTAALSGCSESNDGDESTKINGSIHVAAGKQPGAVRTVNGSIHVDDNAAVTSATTVTAAYTSVIMQQRPR